MIIKHQLNAQKILSHLAGWGFSPQIQERLGAFGVLWAVFETNLEVTLWELRGEKVAGKFPSTESSSVSRWIDLLAEGAPWLGEDAQQVLRSAAAVATDLMVYRHTIVHGWMIPSDKMPSFIRNPTWNGERRKRQSSDAHVDANLLDLAIDTAWILCRVVTTARAACSEPVKINSLVSLRSEVRRVAGQAGELRHLTALMNHEKY